LAKHPVYTHDRPSGGSECNRLWVLKNSGIGVIVCGLVWVLPCSFSAFKW
jgi:hypothetical protein